MPTLAPHDALDRAKDILGNLSLRKAQHKTYCRREIIMGLARRQGAVLAMVAVLGLATVSATFFEDFSSGWQKRWAYSADEKYSGRFVQDTPEGWTEPGLKVGSDTLFPDEPS